LIYLRNSYLAGRNLEAEFTLLAGDLPDDERISAYNKNMTDGGFVSKDLPKLAERFDSARLAADYQAGDIVLHNPCFINASTNNCSPLGRIRLSADIRYEDVDDEIDARWRSAGA
jgi:hypothetical protein